MLTFRGRGDNPREPDDWSNVDISNIVYLFHSRRAGDIGLALRKLYVRWRQASIFTTLFVERVAAPKEAIERF